MTTHKKDADARETEVVGLHRILNGATAENGVTYSLPRIGFMTDGTCAGAVLISHDQVAAFGLPPQAAVVWALELARYALTKAESVDRTLRDQIIEQCYALIDELSAARTHDARRLQ